MRRDLSKRRFWMSRLTLAALALMVTGPAARAQAQAPPKAKAKAAPETATDPVPRAGNWMKMHENFLERARQGNIDLLFLGDSITAGWAGGGKEVWERFYAPRNAANFGIGGDRTQHVLWRIENVEIEGIRPAVVVLMIGTNNSRDNTAVEIAEGVRAIVRKLREKLPDTKVLLLGVFPRGEGPGPLRLKLSEVNETISGLENGETVTYLDIGREFLDEHGRISKEIMPDFLHLTPKGYRIWADALEPTLWKMLDEEKVKGAETKDERAGSSETKSEER
jgi:lysophospholipase L1-like esterase